MPQATDELRQRMLERFGSAIDDYKPWSFLRERGYTENRFRINWPSHTPTEEELECINFLCDEWDWDFAGPPLTMARPGDET